jgi:hypothetical protein
VGLAFLLPAFEKARKPVQQKEEVITRIGNIKVRRKPATPPQTTSNKLVKD